MNVKVQEQAVNHGFYSAVIGPYTHVHPHTHIGLLQAATLDSLSQKQPVAQELNMHNMDSNKGFG